MRANPVRCDPSDSNPTHRASDRIRQPRSGRLRRERRPGQATLMKDRTSPLRAKSADSPVVRSLPERFPSPRLRTSSRSNDPTSWGPLSRNPISVRRRRGGRKIFPDRDHPTTDEPGCGEKSGSAGPETGGFTRGAGPAARGGAQAPARNDEAALSLAGEGGPSCRSSPGRSARRADGDCDQRRRPARAARPRPIRRAVPGSGTTVSAQVAFWNGIWLPFWSSA